MRILLTTTRGAGHFGPLVPFAEAFRRAGDEILFATVRSATGMVEAAGFPVAAVGAAPEDERRAVMAVARELPQNDARRLVVAELFARMDARAAYPGLLAAIDAFRPDMVLHEVAELAGPLAAERAGVPSARVGIGLAGSMEHVTAALLDAVDELREDFGLDPDPLGERLASTPYLTLAPPSLDDSAAAHTLRFQETRVHPRPLPHWWAGDERPLLYLTLGRPFTLHREAIEALAALPMRSLLALDGHRYPVQLGALPGNIRATRGIPQADVLPHTSVVVCDAAFDAVRGALAAAVPLVLMPQSADQARTARRVAELGAGIALDGGGAAIAWLRESVRRVRADHAYRAAAAEIAEDTWALPPVDTAPAALRDLLALV
jgi:UDP:flavonoid glycosyltransferase YjiC (YdhE family)